MTVSILVPIYDVEKYIERCVRSLFGQTFNDIEYIFVDDCSPDNSIAILEKVLYEFPLRKPQTKIVRHAVNRGSADTRNTALDNASGQYVLFVDSDDYLEPDAVRLLYDKAIQEDADMVVFDMKYDFGDKIVDSFETVPADRHDYVKELLLRRKVLGVCGKLFDRSLFPPEMRFANGINYGEDYIVTTTLAYNAHKIVKLDKVLYGYVQTNIGSLTKFRSVERDKRNMYDIEYAVDILCSFFSQVPERNIYSGICDRIKVANKIMLLKNCGTETRRLVAKLYPEVKSAVRTFGVVDRTILLLAHCGLWVLLDAFVSTGLALKRMIR